MDIVLLLFTLEGLGSLGRWAFSTSAFSVPTPLRFASSKSRRRPTTGAELGQAKSWGIVQVRIPVFRLGVRSIVFFVNDDFDEQEQGVVERGWPGVWESLRA